MDNLIGIKDFEIPESCCVGGGVTNKAVGNCWINSVENEE